MAAGACALDGLSPEQASRPTGGEQQAHTFACALGPQVRHPETGEGGKWRGGKVGEQRYGGSEARQKPEIQDNRRYMAEKGSQRKEPGAAVYQNPR